MRTPALGGVCLRNFKCFEDASVAFGNVTVLAGLNGTGKSSVIQSLLLFHQSIQPRLKPYHIDDMRYQGPLVDIGSFKDVLYEKADKEEMGIILRYRGSDAVLRIKHDDVSMVPFTPSGIWPLSDISPLYYLSADRLGPRKMLSLTRPEHDTEPPMGKRGEHVLGFLDRNGDKRVAEAVCHPEESKRTLLAQTNAWMKTVSPGAHFASNTLPEADVGALGFSFSQKGDVATRAFRATNVGFGLSYTLPIVVALLAADRDRLVVVENPEAHLHPGGQVKIAELVARTATAGAQVIVETHSDHILDGVRLAVAETLLRPEQVALHYFQRDGVDIEIVSPQVGSDGRLDVWPDGFFDQQQKTMARLVSLQTQLGGPGQ